ncbi:MAG TPA: hypothetical protein H9870_08945 [Candidatus Corynebacterium avicola]|uniref:Uncharacterized protein n=1 Tax=Candidatus Corynebacterium avicola TaxID=2838527 RepID=A0A9D1RQ83_9CORY|nr:hypothetical protein [Candidatus Corynebacterium avicola]
MTDHTDNTRPGSAPQHPDSDGIPDQVTLEDTVVTPLDRRDPYRLFWLVCQVALWISAVAAVIAVVIGVLVDSENSLLAGIAFLIISMLSVIGILLSRIGSDLKSAGVT